MRILLIAYDFPPIPSPQSLRWAYLVRELAEMGNEVHVLAPDVPGYGPGGLPPLPGSVTVHRVYPGFSMRMFLGRSRANSEISRAKVRKDDGQHEETASGTSQSIPQAIRHPVDDALNWKGRLVYRVLRLPSLKARLAARLKSFVDLCLYPDARAEWLPWARREMTRLLREMPPDAVITSHEPANSIPLGLEAKRKGFRWLADLGDPVLAPYTPARWRRRAFALEQSLCAEADVVTVTSEAASRVLQERHGLPRSRCLVITQGYDAKFAPPATADELPSFDPAKLELLYTGSFYSFRRVGSLLEAVVGTPGVRLSIATIAPPPEVVEASRAFPESVRLLGFMPHRDALLLQRACDVLVNLANEDPVQVPGKLYEYLGAGVPVLHIGGRAGDAAVELLEGAHVGVCEPDVAGSIRQRLVTWREQKQLGEQVGGATRRGSVECYRWDALAARVATACAGRS